MAMRLPTYFISHGGGPWPWMKEQLGGAYDRLPFALSLFVVFEEASLREVGLTAVHAWSDTPVAHPLSVDWDATMRDTERMLLGFGCAVDAAHGVVTIEPPARLQACSLEVPGDFSSSAFFLIAGAISQNGAGAGAGAGAISGAG